MKQITQIQDNKTLESDNERNETRVAIEKEQQRETARSINRQADELKRGSSFAMGPLNKPIQTPTAPAQAQHSPLPHVKENFHSRLDVALDKMRRNIVPELSVCIIAEAYDALHANAQRLADAAKQVECDWNITRRKYLPSSMAKLREVLAEWSKSV